MNATQEHPLMACGCAAQGYELKDGVKRPICLVHLCVDVVDTVNLEGRTAYCVYCSKSAPSSRKLAFFGRGRWVQGAKTDEEDSYYCGCRGWD